MKKYNQRSAFTSVRWIALVAAVSVCAGAVWSNLTAAPKVHRNGSVSVDNIYLPVSNIDTSIDEFTQPVLTSSISASDNLVAFQGDFTFDSTIVSFQSPPVSKSGMTDGNWNVSAMFFRARVRFAHCVFQRLRWMVFLRFLERASFTI